METIVKIDKKAAEKILGRIKGRFEIFRIIKKREEFLFAHQFMDIYIWVQRPISYGLVDTCENAVRTLADSAKANPTTVRKYYDCGRFMREHRFTPDGVSGYDIMSAQGGGFANLKKSEQLRILSIIKGRKGHVSREMRVARMRSGLEGNRRVKALKKEGRLNKTYLKMELMALQTVLSEFFKDDIAIFCISKKTGDTLISIGEK